MGRGTSENESHETGRYGSGHRPETAGKAPFGAVFRTGARIGLHILLGLRETTVAAIAAGRLHDDRVATIERWFAAKVAGLPTLHPSAARWPRSAASHWPAGGDIRRLCELFGLSVAGADRYTAVLDRPGIDEP